MQNPLENNRILIERNKPNIGGYGGKGNSQ